MLTEVYCDAGISPARMPTPNTSTLVPELVGRIVVLIPDLDYGCIEQVDEGITDKKGNPSSNFVEILGIRRAKEICLQKKLKDFEILTDVMAEAVTTGVPEARWIDRGRQNLASLFLQRIVNRARYLRRSSRKVVTKTPTSLVQSDEFRLFNAERLEFRLSESALWNKIQSDFASAKSMMHEREGIAHANRVDLLLRKLAKLRSEPVSSAGEVSSAKTSHQSPAVYLLLTPDKSAIVYVGRTITKAIQGRIYDHLHMDQSSDLRIMLTRYPDYPQDPTTYNVQYLAIHDSRERMLFKDFCIAVLDPPFNR